MTHFEKKIQVCVELLPLTQYFEVRNFFKDDCHTPCYTKLNDIKLNFVILRQHFGTFEHAQGLAKQFLLEKPILKFNKIMLISKDYRTRSAKFGECRISIIIISLIKLELQIDEVLTSIDKERNKHLNDWSIHSHLFRCHPSLLKNLKTRRPDPCIELV